jgi:hypothetical protein
VACANRSAESVATVTASTAQPASQSERISTARQTARKFCSTSSALPAEPRSSTPSSTAPARSTAAPINCSLPSGKW